MQFLMLCETMLLVIDFLFELLNFGFNAEVLLEKFLNVFFGLLIKVVEVLILILEFHNVLLFY